VGRLQRRAGCRPRQWMARRGWMVIRPLLNSPDIPAYQARIARAPSLRPRDRRRPPLAVNAAASRPAARRTANVRMRGRQRLFRLRPKTRYAAESRRRPTSGIEPYNQLAPMLQRRSRQRYGRFFSATANPTPGNSSIALARNHSRRRITRCPPGAAVRHFTSNRRSANSRLRLRFALSGRVIFVVGSHANSTVSQPR